MNRPPAEALTERELEVMHVFWASGQQSAQVARDELEKRGRTLTYTTVATLCKNPVGERLSRTDRRFATIRFQAREVLSRSVQALR